MLKHTLILALPIIVSYGLQIELLLNILIDNWPRISQVLLVAARMPVLVLISIALHIRLRTTFLVFVGGGPADARFSRAAPVYLHYLLLYNVYVVLGNAHSFDQSVVLLLQVFRFFIQLVILKSHLHQLFLGQSLGLLG